MRWKAAGLLLGRYLRRTCADSGAGHGAEHGAERGADAVRNAVRQTVRGTVRDAVPNTVRETVRETVRDAGRIFAWECLLRTVTMLPVTVAMKKAEMSMNKTTTAFSVLVLATMSP